MKQEKNLNQGFEAAINKKTQGLIRKYVPGPVFEKWLNTFKANLKRYKWDLEMTREKAMGDCFFWIECLLKTWREEIGPPRKPTPSFRGKKSGSRPDLHP